MLSMIVGAKQKGDEPPPSHVSVSDVALVVVPANCDTPAGAAVKWLGGFEG